MREMNMTLAETALNKTSKAANIEGEVYDDGYLRVEHNNYYLTCGGQSLKLARTEFLIISRLARSAGRIVTAADLWEHAWGSSKPLNPESLHVYIYRLRNKLAPFHLQIDTMVSVGYRLVINPDVR
jgi:DNA-binding response OmpR family regulator